MKPFLCIIFVVRNLVSSHDRQLFTKLVALDQILVVMKYSAVISMHL